MIKLNMHILAIVATLATTLAFTITTPTKTASTTSLSYYGTAPYRTGYGYGTGYHNRYDDDMYGDYNYNRRGMNSYYRGDDWDKATLTREPFYYDGRDNNHRSSYYGYGRGHGHGMDRYGYGYGRNYYQPGYDTSGRYPGEVSLNYT